VSAYTVKRVADSPREWSSKQGGTFLSYTVDLEGEGGKVEAGVEWNRKPESRAPEVGDRIAGTIEPGKFSERFKMDYEATKELSGGGSTGSSGGADYGRRGGGGGKSPDQQASIVRQHSQEMAIRVLAAIGSPPELDTGALKTNLKDWTDFFAADAGAAQAANRTGGSSSPQPSVPPQASDTQGVHELLTELFVKAGEAEPIATLLTGWVIETQAVEKQDKALAALREPESAAVVVKWAREGYEAKHGPLPGVSTDIDDGIPFARPEYGEVFSERERHSNRP
jgi:hypothetical protein